MTIVLIPLLQIIDFALDLYRWVVIAAILFSWLLNFGVINTYNRGVAMLGDVLARLTEPALRPIRQILPDFGAIDISPVVLFLLISFIQMVDMRMIEALLRGG